MKSLRLFLEYWINIAYDWYKHKIDYYKVRKYIRKNHIIVFTMKITEDTSIMVDSHYIYLMLLVDIKKFEKKYNLEMIDHSEVILGIVNDDFIKNLITARIDVDFLVYSDNYKGI